MGWWGSWGLVVCIVISTQPTFAINTEERWFPVAMNGTLLQDTRTRDLRTKKQLSHLFRVTRPSLLGWRPSLLGGGHR